MSGVSSQDFDLEEGIEDVTNDVSIHSLSNNASTELDINSGKENFVAFLRSSRATCKPL